MRSIVETYFNRLVVQAKEAEIQGMTKLSEHITNQLEQNEVRGDDEKYSYSSEDLEFDVEKNLWSAIIRVADFHNVNLDVEKISNIAEFVSNKLIEHVRAEAGVVHGVGAYEEALPGESKEQVEIEVDGP